MPRSIQIALLCIFCCAGFAHISSAQTIYRSELRKQWEKLTDLNPGSSFLVAVGITSAGAKQSELRQLLLEASEIGRTLTLPVPQGANPSIPVSSTILEWNSKAVESTFVSAGIVLGSLQLANAPTQFKQPSRPVATVSGQLLRPLAPVKTVLPPSKPMCHIMVKGEGTLVAIALVSVQGNPRELGFILRYCAELNPRIAPDLARTFAWAFPSKIQQIHQLLKGYAHVPSLEALHRDFDPLQKETPKPSQPSQTEAILLPYLYRNYGYQNYIYR